MKADEIDKIIADALAENDKSKTKRRRRSSQASTVRTVRKVLNAVFIAGFIAAVIVYFLLPEQRLLFYSLGYGAMFLKLIEFLLRFLF